MNLSIFHEFCRIISYFEVKWSSSSKISLRSLAHIYPYMKELFFENDLNNNNTAMDLVLLEAYTNGENI